MYNSNYTGKEMDGLRYCGTIMLSVPAPTTLTLTDTYYKVLGTFSVNGFDEKFTANADGSTTYNGENGQLVVIGTSDVKLDAASKLTYALFKNDVLIPGAETPHDYDAANKTENISIVGVINIETGDKLQVWAKSSGVGDVVTPATLNMVFRKK